MVSEKPQSFQRFTLLPPELRHQIWSFAIADYPPRLIEFIGRYAPYNALVHAGAPQEEEVLASTPPFLSICQESRRLITKSTNFLNIKMDDSFSLDTHRTIYFDPRKDTIFPNFGCKRHFEAFLRRLLNSNDSPTQNITIALSLLHLYRSCTPFVRQYTTPATGHGNASRGCLVVAPEGHSATYSLRVVIQVHRQRWVNALGWANVNDGRDLREVLREVTLSENPLVGNEELMWRHYGKWYDDLLERAGWPKTEKVYVFRLEDQERKSSA